MALRSKSFRGPSLAGFIFYLRTFLLYRIEILSKIVDCARGQIFLLSKDVILKLILEIRQYFWFLPGRFWTTFGCMGRKKKFNNFKSFRCSLQNNLNKFFAYNPTYEIHQKGISTCFLFKCFTRDRLRAPSGQFLHLCVIEIVY